MADSDSDHSHDEDEEPQNANEDDDFDVPHIEPVNPMSLFPMQVLDHLEYQAILVTAGLNNEVTKETAKLLLLKADWDVTIVVTEALKHQGGIKGYCEEKGVFYGNTQPDIIEDHEDKTIVTCDLCGEEKPSKIFYRHHCGDKFCIDCWKEHLANQIQMLKGVTITCPSCPAGIDRHLVRELITDENLYLRYLGLVAGCFADTSPGFCPCSAPDCHRVFKKGTATGWVVGTCGCGFEQCMDCRVEWHGPLDCEGVKMWNAKINSGDEDSQRWLEVNCKKCPKCSTPIEKTGGCNWMNCHNCKYQFCWMCLGPAHDHSFGNACSKFGKEQAKEQMEALDPARRELERFTFYGERFANQRGNIRLDERLIPIVEDKIRFLVEKDGQTHHDLQFLMEAVFVLKRARRYLMNSYALMYLLVDSKPRDLFDMMIPDLLNVVERMGSYMQHELPKAKTKNAVNEELAGKIAVLEDIMKKSDTQAEGFFLQELWTYARPPKKDEKKE